VSSQKKRENSRSSQSEHLPKYLIGNIFFEKHFDWIFYNIFQIVNNVLATVVMAINAHVATVVVKCTKTNVL
jgi:hypothetical protein